VRRGIKWSRNTRLRHESGNSVLRLIYLLLLVSGNKVSLNFSEAVFK